MSLTRTHTAPISCNSKSSRVYILYPNTFVVSTCCWTLWKFISFYELNVEWVLNANCELWLCVCVFRMMRTKSHSWLLRKQTKKNENEKRKPFNFPFPWKASRSAVLLVANNRFLKSRMNFFEYTNDNPNDLRCSFCSQLKMN